MHRSGQAHLYMCKFVRTSFLPCSLWHRVSNKPELNELAPRILSAFQALELHVDHPGSSWVLRLQTQILTLSCKVLYQLSHLPSIQNASFRDYSEEQTPKAVSAMRKGLPCASAKLTTASALGVKFTACHTNLTVTFNLSQVGSSNKLNSNRCCVLLLICLPLRNYSRSHTAFVPLCLYSWKLIHKLHKVPVPPTQ